MSQRKYFTKEKIFVEEETLWSDIAVLQSETAESEICADEETRHRFACGKMKTVRHEKLNKKGGKTISNQPIIFNITYTPWKLKSNATVQERKKFERERPYYEMRNGEKNIYKYMTSDRKLNGENSKSDMRDMITYFEKSTGVFKYCGTDSSLSMRK